MFTFLFSQIAKGKDYMAVMFTFYFPINTTWQGWNFDVSVTIC